jgi:acyl CoA:acetate/3-ketoacid CoA transferase alpha subunit
MELNMNESKIVSPVVDDIKFRMKRGKIVSADEAVRVIHSGDTVAIDGVMGGGAPEELIIAVEKRFLENQEPRDLKLVYASGIGDGKDKGLNRLAHKGLIKRIVAGHWGLTPKLQELAVAGQIEAYNLPQGIIAHMFRDTAAHKPRTISSVGIGTYIDPRLGGGKINAATTEDLVEIVTFKRKGLPGLQDHSGTGRPPQGHDGRHGRQYHDGTRGHDSRSASDRHGGKELGRHCNCPGRAHRRPARPEPAAREDPRRPRRLRCRCET